MNAPETTPPNIVIDRRPIWIVVVDRMRRGILLAIIFLVFALALTREGPAELGPEAYRVLCLFFLCVILWATNLIPLSATSLLAIGMIPVLGIMDATQVYSFFGNKAVFFILGTFILSGAMIACGLSARIALWVLESRGDNPVRLLGAIYTLGLLGSCIMSEHAVAAMLFPIVLDIVQTLRLPSGRSPFAKSLFFALAWGCIIGGSATVLGGGRVPLTLEILEKTTHYQHTLGILEYSLMVFPLVVLMGAGGWAVLMLLFRPEAVDLQPALQNIHRKREQLGKVTFYEMGIGAVLTVTLFVWFAYGERFGIANIALFSIVVLFLFNLITWEKVQPHVNWAIILMYGGAICLGEVMAQSGAALWLAQKVFGNLIQSKTVFLLTVVALSTLFTTIMSNSAVIAVLLPPVLSLCTQYAIDPVLAAMTVVVPSNFAFILPIATPASALAYSSRCISLGEMAFSGGLLALLGGISYWILLQVYWPAMGWFGGA